MTRAGWGRLVVVALLAGSSAGSGAQTLVDPATGSPGPAAGSLPAVSVRWRPAQVNGGWVEVVGLGHAALKGLRQANWQPAQWRRLLTVHAEQGDVIDDLGLPAMLGTYRVESELVRFDPQFPLVPGLRYRATFRPAELPGASATAAPPVSAAFRLTRPEPNPTTVVSQVYPTGDVLPENLLKFYVHFSAPMSGGRIYEHIHLRDATGREVELPFLEIDEELWDRAMKRLTLFIDPGRIKRGVRPLEEIGPALEAGQRYTLAIDEAWPDAAGNPLRARFEKTFLVGPPDRDPPEPARWQIHPPKGGTREPVVVLFPEPMDHALALRVIHVVGEDSRGVAGTTALGDQERRWAFTPRDHWRRGPYKLAVQSLIEDLAGNNVGKPFEVDLFEGVQRRFTNSTVALVFNVP